MKKSDGLEKGHSVLQCWGYPRAGSLPGGRRMDVNVDSPTTKLMGCSPSPDSYRDITRFSFLRWPTMVAMTTVPLVCVVSCRANMGMW